MGFACKCCGYLNEVKPQYSEEQNKRYLDLEKKVRKLESEVKKINKDCTEELERRKEKRNKFSILCGIGSGAGFFYILGWILNTPSVLAVSFSAVGAGICAVGAGLAVQGVLVHSFRLNLERIFKEKYPERAKSKDFSIFWYSKEVKLSRKYYGELIKQKWNCSFTCCFCGKQNRFWKKS